MVGLYGLRTDNEFRCLHCGVFTSPKRSVVFHEIVTNGVCRDVYRRGRAALFPGAMVLRRLFLCVNC